MSVTEADVLRHGNIILYFAPMSLHECHMAKAGELERLIFVAMLQGYWWIDRCTDV